MLNRYEDIVIWCRSGTIRLVRKMRSGKTAAALGRYQWFTIVGESNNSSQRNDEGVACYAYLQRGGFSQVSKVIPAVHIVGENVMTLGARQRVGDIGGNFEPRVDECIAHHCRLSTGAIVKC